MPSTASQQTQLKMSHQADMYKQDPDTDDDDTTMNKLGEYESEWYDGDDGVVEVLANVTFLVAVK